MSSVVSFGTNTAAKRKRVYYAGDSTIYEGMPLCYDILALSNVLGYDKGAGGDPGCQTSPSTTAEGNLNEGKFLRVVNPVNVSTSGGTATAGVIADTEFTGTELPGVGTHVNVTGTNMTDAVYRVTAVSDGVSCTVDAGSADVTGTSVTVVLDNLNAFAGVVAHGGRKGNTGPCWLDIFVPNGAIVPVRTDQSCVAGRTVLSVHAAEQHLTGPYENGCRPVAIAQETNTALATTAGLVLAKLDPNMFISQVGDAGKLLIDDQDTGNTLWLNKIKVDFTSATGNCCAFTTQATSSAGANTGSYYGLALYAQADVTATPSGDVVASGHWINITGGTPANDLCGLMVGVYEDGATMSSIGHLSVLTLVTQVADTCKANTHSWIYLMDNGTDEPDFLFQFSGLGAASDYVSTSDAPALATGDLMIPIRVGSTTYYLVGLADTGV